MEISNSSNSKRSSDQSHAVMEKKRLTSWETKRAVFQSKLEELNALSFREVMRARSPRIRNHEITVLQEHGITTFGKFLMQPVQLLLKTTEAKFLKERLQTIYNEVASSMETVGTYQYHKSFNLKSNNISVETTTSSSTVAFTKWIATQEKNKAAEKPMGIHVHKCSGTPVAIVVCLGSVTYVLHLVLEGLSSELLLPLLRIGRGGLGCTQETEQTLSHYLNLPRLSHSDVSEISVTLNSSAWVNETRLGKRQIESMLKLGYSGYHAAACAMWTESTSPTLLASKRVDPSLKCLVSPDLLKLIGETYITKSKILEQLMSYIRVNHLQDKKTKKITGNSDLMLLLNEAAGPLTEKDIRRLLNPSLKQIK